MLISFSLCSIISSAEDKEISVESQPITTEEINTAMPSNITGQDIIDLLRFAGVPLTEEQIRHLRSLRSETEKFVDLTEEQQETILNLTEEQKTALLKMTTEEKMRFIGLTERQKRRLLRQAQQDMMLSHAIRQAHSRSYKSTIVHQVKGFHIEALVFYAAMGASMAVQARMDAVRTGSALDVTGLPKESKADPRWMETLIHEMTSPVGIFSFFCFVIASGQVNTFFAKGLTSNIGLKQTPDRVQSRLTNNRLNALNGSRRGISPRVIPRVGLSLGGPFGMATGMFASNIVHEIHFTFTQNPHRKPCQDFQLGKSELEEDSRDQANSKLHCDLLFEELLHTSRSWLAGVASLISASFISHFLVNQAYKVSIGTAISTRSGAQAIGRKINTGILKGVTVPASRIPWGVIARGAFKLVPIPIVRAGQVVNHGIKNAMKFIVRHIRPGGRGHSFLNLTTFMLTDIWFTHGVAGKLIAEPETANDVAYDIEDFMRYHSVDHTTDEEFDFLSCNDDGSDCSYHDSIISAHHMGLSFNRWRQFQTQSVWMAYQNWFKYVSETLGSYESAYTTYKAFFEAKETPNHIVHAVDYFGVPEEPAKKALGEMLEMINEEIDTHNLTRPEYLNTHVVSASPTRFLKPPEELFAQERATQKQQKQQNEYENDMGFFQRVWTSTKRVFTGYWRKRKEEGRLFTLQALLSSVDNSGPSIEDFFGDEWDQVLQQEKATIIKNVDILKKFFSDMKEHFEEEKNNFQNNSSSMNERDKLAHLVRGNDSFFEVLQGEEILPLFRILNDDTIQFLNQIIEQNSINGELLQSALDELNIAGDDAINHLDSLVPVYFDNWIEWLDAQAERFSGTDILDDTKIAEIVKEKLRNKVQSSAIEYLKWIIEQKKKEGSGRHYYIENPDHLPPEILPLFHRLGEDNIFAKLYAKTFIEIETEESAPDETQSAIDETQSATDETPSAIDETPQYVQITPLPSGRLFTVLGNSVAERREEAFDLDLHPDRIAHLRTPGIIDFFIGSALCGPNLSEDKNELLLQKIEDSTAPLSEVGLGDTPVFDRRMGGMNYNFYPPRVTTIDEVSRTHICNGLHNRGNRFNSVQDIYNGHFPVGDKVYHNLFNLVLDHIGLQEVSSLQEFEDWWQAKVEPYIELFILSAEEEYERLVQNKFIPVLFHEGTKDVNIFAGSRSRLVSVDDSSSQSVSDQMFTFTGEWIKEEPHIHNATSQVELTQNVLSLDKGAFQNIYFEVLYWADIILHYSQKLETSIPSEDLEALKTSLSAFAEGFNTETAMSVKKSLDPAGTEVVEDISFHSIEESMFSNDTQQSLYWAKNFLENMRALSFLFSGVGEYDSINEILNIESEALSALPLGNNLQPSDEALRDMERNAIGVFSCDSNRDMQSCEERVSVPKQILNYSMIKLTHLLQETMNYAELIGNIFEHSDVDQVTRDIFDNPGEI